MAPITGVFVNSRKQKLHTLKYPAKGTPVAQLFIHHGLAEHCGRYDNVCQSLADQGIEVNTFDAHGHGKSEPKEEGGRAFIGNYKHLVNDMCDFMDFVHKNEAAALVPTPAAAAATPDAGSAAEGAAGAAAAAPEAPHGKLPVFVLGHSMGGLVAALMALRRQEQLAGVMLHSPALDVEWNPMLRVQAAVGGLMSALIPHAKLVPAVRPEDMSQDPAVVASYLNDPLNTQGNVRTRTGNEMLRGFAEVGKNATKLTLPVYVAHGTKDACTSAAASRRFVEGPGGVSSADKTFRAVEGGYHELLHGPEWRDCTEHIAAWIKSHAAAAAGKEGAKAEPGSGSKL
ncbi:hypothetical protein HXX76_001421 [Chlamydomonas incerta]|uniref:Serine aminopeptidase S33 domain-containing protein n=1 Tax=Chlamydomonas incerta TaxID=51695 RepID=A0A835WC50_CHLIN|nr:hypothetical protein HXX76_001421 [Chlamydomonas incerta]|eukprot:KAG2444677.1 hypothetical protein HXX76_001421 [Chlamydomonas incerta]